MNIFNIISLFGGLALFLYGMRIMGDGLRSSSSGALKHAMEKVTNNPFVGFLLGLAVTCIIQSSTATIVLTSGLVGAGIITLHQSLGVILGANVGTTITGQIIRLLDINSDGASWLTLFKPSTLAPIAAIIGMILIMAFRFRHSDTIGGIAIGFSILFTGLLNMTAAVTPLSESEAFARLFLNLADKPLVEFLVGAGAAFLIQSSSATVGILQALSTTGQLTFGSVYPIIIGIYIGDCVTTAIVCSISAKADAKRTGLVHILFNLGGAALVAIGATLLHRFGVLDAIWSRSITSGGIANANTIFKLSTSILLLPFCGLFEKLSRILIKDDKATKAEAGAELAWLDRTLFKSPGLALTAAHNVIATMADFASANVRKAFDGLHTYDKEAVTAIQEDEEYIDTMADRVSDYLIQLSPYITVDTGNDQLNYDIKCVSEFERIGDYAVNLTENAEELLNQNAQFSDTALKELSLLQDAIRQITGYAIQAFVNQDSAAAMHIEPIEEVIDDLVSTLRSNHIDRLKAGKCNVDAGLAFLDILVNSERISDHCSNVGVMTVALGNASAHESEHDYIRDLHQGKNSSYNAEYQTAHEDFFSRLSAIESVAE